MVNPAQILRPSEGGVEPCLLLELSDQKKADAVLGGPRKVAFADRGAKYILVLAGEGLRAVQQLARQASRWLPVRTSCCRWVHGFPCSISDHT
jgi:hypothetical protein